MKKPVIDTEDILSLFVGRSVDGSLGWSVSRSVGSIPQNPNSNNNSDKKNIEDHYYTWRT